MIIILEPTPEMFDAPINGQKIPVRIWRGRTTSGIAIEAYVLAITPDNPDDTSALQAEVPAFMGRARDRYQIDTSNGG